MGSMWKQRSSAREEYDYHPRASSGFHFFSRRRRAPSDAALAAQGYHPSNDSIPFRSGSSFSQRSNAPLYRTPSNSTLRDPHSARYPPHSSHSDRFNPPGSARSGNPMAGMMDVDRSRSRRERTFIGSECAVCEEPLEHTLRGERVLQFNCGHVSHEACFYEFIKEFESQYCPTCNTPISLDSSRSGNVVDIEKLSSIVRSASLSDAATQRSEIVTPTPWDRNGNRPVRTPTQEDSARSYRTRDTMSQRETSSQRERVPSRQQHSRNDSAATATAADYVDPHHLGPTRKHDYDVQAMESDLSPRPGTVKNPIPAPIVTVRSEFPTMTRARQQQALTCLVTVEVPDGRWRPDMEDLRYLQTQVDDSYSVVRSPPAPPPPSRPPPMEPQEHLDEIAEDLRLRVDNWHGLDFSRFGKLRLYGVLRVGKDRESWQELECFLFGEMLICVKEKKINGDANQYDENGQRRRATRCTLKGSILIKKHLREVEASIDEPILQLKLSVSELPCFYLRFPNRGQLDVWRRALLDLHHPEPPVRNQDYDVDASGTEDDDYRTYKTQRQSSNTSSYGAAKSNATALTDYSHMGQAAPVSFHVPLDLVVVIPISSSMQGLKISLLRDALKFLVQNLGPRDRMGLVTFGSSGGGVPLVGMTTKTWPGWGKIVSSLRPVGQKSLRSDMVDGANVAMDLLMQRKSSNPISAILLISDSSSSDFESVDFVVSRAEAAKVGIYSFGLGLTHKPDTLIELSSRTKASYTYVKDWMMLRECVAGCLGALQSTSHQNVKLKLRLPEGSPAKFVKISGALHTTKRSTGRDAEAALGDLRFGDKRDILVQLAIQPDNSSEHVPQDPWESIVSGLEALGGGSDDDQRVASVEEVPLLQADLTYGDILRDGHLTHSPRPSLLAITMLPANPRAAPGQGSSPSIPPHPSIVQRRMELLASDMLTRALTLVSKGQHDRAQHLLTETRSILKGLGKGGLPPLPSGANKSQTDSNSTSDTPGSTSPRSSHVDGNSSAGSEATIAPAAAVDSQIMAALDADLETALEWINHPAVFGRDSRKAVLQAIGVISSQRAFTFRTPSETLWAERISGVKRLTERSKEWREAGDEALTEE